MKKICKSVILFLSLFYSFSIQSQVQVFWNETFSNSCPLNCPAAAYTGSNGAWTVTNTGTNGTENNPWYVSSAENGNDPGTCGTPNGSDPCLHIGSPAAVSGDIGARFVNTGLGGIYNILTDIRAESPTIDCSGKTNITISFNYMENGDGLNDNATLWYFDGTTWSLLIDLAKTTLCVTDTGTWTAYSQLLPGTADNNANVKIGFRWVNNDDGIGNDPSIAVDDIILSTGIANSITTGAIAGSPFCGCDSVMVPFTSTGSYTLGNVYTAQLSDTADNFANPIVIGTLTDTTNVDTIHCMIPCGSSSGTSYIIRVIASTPSTTGTVSIDTISIDSVVVPVVTISTASTNLLCIDTAVVFTAASLNGGLLPTYQWHKNGANVGANSSSYTSAGSLMSGDSISVTLTSSSSCASPTTAFGIVSIDCPQLEIPNVFTPNNDGINDLFKVNLSGQALQNFNINIYDRWGILIFSSPSVNYKWDGRTTSGQKVVNGTYFYIIDLNGKQYKGAVSVLE